MNKLTLQKGWNGANVLSTIKNFVFDECRFDRMSLQDAESAQISGSTFSEKLKTSVFLYRALLKINDIIVNNFETEIPEEVEKLINKYIRKTRIFFLLSKNKKTII